ncbi:hypothetical protein HHI36_016578 [Cryptolaemus montrouzieri]|uniref:Uncharacterized protein n=1 Tax=Cryptolaemus montrouzieri TaxID=559131 RepID=A0ABD2NKJ6_9CUCU
MGFGVIFAICVICFVGCIAAPNNQNLKEDETLVKAFERGRELVEQGRTFVHHAVKRFMIILPAIFFKLGIAFTLLLIVTLVAVNNGFIGFLLLVVGMSSVLARLQEARRPAVVPYIQSLPASYHHGWDRTDRSDNTETQVMDSSKIYAYTGQNTQQYVPSVGYYTKYVTND